MKSRLSALQFALPVLLLLAALPLSAQNVQIESFQGKEAVAGEILVRFKGATNEAQGRALAAQEFGISSAEPVGRNGTMLLRSGNRDVAALMQVYSSRLDVLFAEPNHIWRASDYPNDALFDQQWGLNNTGQALQGVSNFPGIPGTTGADIGAAQAWDITTGSRAIVVGVVDTGFDYNHPDLMANVWSAPADFTVTINGQAITCLAGSHGFNAITRTCDPMDDAGHGTHVSGIIGASGNNGAGVSGVSRVASLMSSKFLSASGSGSTSDAVAALDFLVQVKALFPIEANIRVLNASWGGGAFSQTLLDEISLLNNQGILFVAAAGNSAVNTDLSPTYPNAYDAPNILSVAATDNTDALASFSNWGPATTDIGAPGVSVLSTLPSGTYGFTSGTSMAAPMVSGAASLVLAACPMTTAALKADLMGTADEIPALAQRVLSGGRLNVFRSLSACAPPPAPGFRLSVSPGTANMDLDSSVSFSVDVTPVGPFAGSVDLRATSLPNGMSATFNPSVISNASGTSTLTITTGSSVASGTHLIGIRGVYGLTEVLSGVSINAGPVATPIAPGQTVLGALSPSDRISTEQPGSYADFYTLTVAATTPVTIDLKSNLFDAYLYVLSSTGTVIFSSASGGGAFDARLTTVLLPGTYQIEATTSDRGQGHYSLSINTPTITTITPRTGLPGTTFTVSLSGTRFVPPMTIDAGAGISVTDIVVISPALATATFAIANGATPGPRSLTVTTAEGISNPMAYPVPRHIEPGQTISGSVSTSDLSWPNTTFRYTDLYEFTLDANTEGSVTVDVVSTGFDSIVGLFSANGTIITSSNDSAGPNNDRISTTLSSGTYYLEVTSQQPAATGDYVLSLYSSGLTAITPRFVEQGASTSITLTGSRFALPLTVNAGADIAASSVQVASSTSASAMLTVAGNASPGDRPVTVSVPSGITNPVVLKIVPPIPSIVLGDTVSGMLSASDVSSLATTNATMDLYRLTLTAATRVTITLESNDFDPTLFVLSSSGSIIASNNDSLGDHNSRITTILGTGTFFLQVTSALDRQEGHYTLSVLPVVFGLTSVSPRFGGRGSTFQATLSGPGLTGPITIDAGPGVLIGPVNVQFGVATATFTIAVDAPLGVHDVTAISPTGTTNAVSFNVYDIPDVMLGETRLETLSITDRASPSRTASYGDLYRLTLNAAAFVEIAVSSTDFNSYAYVLSASGSILFADDQSGGSNNARIRTALAPGTYFIEATSATAGLGDYTLSVLEQPGTLNFSRALAASELASAGIAIVNPGSTDAAVQYTLYDNAGGVVDSATETVPARGQLARLASELFPGVQQGGWIQAKSATPGLIGFWLGGDFASTMDGAEASPEASELVFPLVTGFTEINIVNLGDITDGVLIRAYGSAGTLLGVTVRSVAGLGVLQSSAAALFPTVNFAGDTISVRASGTQPLTGTSVTQDFPLGPSWTVVNGVSSSTGSTQAYFPHVVSGSQDGMTSWTSILGVTNLSAAVTQTVTVTFTPVSGVPVSVTRTVARLGTLRESIQSLFGFPTFYQEGWLRVSGTSPITSFIAYGYDGSAGAAVTPGQITSRSSMMFAHVADGPSWATGLALLNPSPVNASVEVYVMRNTGTLVGKAAFVMPPGTKIAELLTELVPASDANDGFVYIRSLNNIPLYGMELFFSSDLKLIANVAPGFLDAVTYTPPTAVTP